MQKIRATTTFQKLYDAKACKDRYKHLAKALGGITKYGRNKPINLLQILKHNGLDDFFWVLNVVSPNEIFRLMACDFAESVLPIFEKQHPNDTRPRDTIATARRFAIGEATSKELSAAWSAAWRAARNAKIAASDAGIAAGYDAWDAARNAKIAARYAGDAARGAASDAGIAARNAGYAARNAGYAAERENQIKIIKSYLK